VWPDNQWRGLRLCASRSNPVIGIFFLLFAWYVTKENAEFTVILWNVYFLRRSRWFCGRLLTGIAGSNSAGGMDVCLSVVSVVCCHVEVSASVWSLVRRSPTECDGEASIERRPWLLRHEDNKCLLANSDMKLWIWPTYKRWNMSFVWQALRSIAKGRYSDFCIDFDPWYRQKRRITELCSSLAQKESGAATVNITVAAKELTYQLQTCAAVVRRKTTVLPTETQMQGHCG
jgi:hypothetical protein